MSDVGYVPQPRYSKEHQQQAVAENRPLFTLDIYYPRGTKSKHGMKRTTVTGVLTEREIEHALARIIANRLEIAGTGQGR